MKTKIFLNKKPTNIDNFRGLSLTNKDKIEIQLKNYTLSDQYKVDNVLAVINACFFRK